MKKTRRILSLVLTLCLLGTLLSGICLTASAADEQYTVTYSVPDGQTPPTAATVNAGSSVTLPTDAYTPNGYIFAGWSLSEITEESPSASLLGNSFTPEADTVLYAVYKSSHVDYVKISSEPAAPLSGKYLIVCESKSIAFDSDFGSSAFDLNKAGNYVSVTVSDGKIEATADLDAAAVTLTKSGDAYNIITNQGLYIGSTGKSSEGINGSNKSYTSTISWAEDETGTVAIANVDGTTHYNFMYNDSKTASAQRFYYIKPEKGTACKVSLFGRTEYYTTEGCKHANATFETIICTCTEDGKTVYTCPDCGYVWEENVIPATGHNFDDGVVTPATETTFGYTTYTCQNEGCGYSEQREFTGWEWQLTLNVPGEEPQTQTVSSYDGIELPAAKAVDGYTFRGWFAAELDDATEATLLKGLYKPTEDITLYAVYSSNTYNEGDGNYKKVTADDSIVSGGQYLIVNEDNAVAFDGNADDITKAGNYLSNIEISEDTIAQSEDLDNASVTIVPIDDSENYAMILSNGKYLGHTGNSAGISSRGENYGPYSIDISATTDGTVIADAAASSYILRYNFKAGGEVFKFYAAANDNYLPVSLYYKDGSGYVTLYTTSPNLCSHLNTTSEYTAPTCLDAGYTAYSCPDCGYSWIESNEDTDKPLGHDFEGVSATCNDNGTHSRICNRCSEAIIENCKYDKDTHLCSSCGYPQPSVTVTYNAAGTIIEETVYGTTTLPETAEAVEGYNFVGWSETQIDTQTTELPATRKGTFSPKEDTTLYAVYVRSEIVGPGTGSGDYIKVTDNEDLTEGKYLVVYEGSSIAYNSSFADNASDMNKLGNYIQVSISDDTITAVYSIDAAALTIAPIDGSAYFSMKANCGKYIGNLGSGTGFNMNGDTVYQNSITVSDGIATIQNVPAEGKTLYQFRYNARANTDRFAFWGTETSTCRDVSLYKKDGTGPEMAYYYVTNLATELKIKSASLRLDEDIDVIYTATVPAGYTDVSMTFTMNGESVIVPDDGTHIFVFEGVTPQCFGDNISATLTATCDDEQFSDEIAEYSVRAYCVRQLANDTISAELRTLLSDVLAYGAAAQNYMSYKTDDPVTKDVEGATYSTYTELPDLTATFSGTAADNICWTGAGIKLTNNVAMFFRFYAESVDGLTVTVSVNSREETFTEFTAVGENLYEITFAGIKANEFGDAVTASFSTGGNTVSYSVNTYICAKQADSDANLAALVKALYNYGAAAAAYAK